MHSRILAIIRKETREVLRDPVYLGLAIAVPLIIMILLGLGFVLDVKNGSIAVSVGKRAMEKDVSWKSPKARLSHCA